MNGHLALDVNGRQDVAGTPLHVAIRNCAWDDPSLYRGHHEVVKVLLAAGADVRLPRKWEGTPLQDAARLGLTHIAEIIISYGADVNSKEDAQREWDRIVTERPQLALAGQTTGRLGGHVQWRPRSGKAA